MRLVETEQEFHLSSRDFHWQRTKASLDLGRRRTEEFQPALNEFMDALRAFSRIIGAREIKHDVGMRGAVNMRDGMDDHPVGLALMLFRSTLLEETAVNRIEGERFPKLFGHEFGSGQRSGEELDEIVGMRSGDQLPDTLNNIGIL
jgi:hypothetical protein